MRNLPLEPWFPEPCHRHVSLASACHHQQHPQGCRWVEPKEQSHWNHCAKQRRACSLPLVGYWSSSAPIGRGAIAKCPRHPSPAAKHWGGDCQCSSGAETWNGLLHSAPSKEPWPSCSSSSVQLLERLGLHGRASTLPHSRRGKDPCRQNPIALASHYNPSL